MLLEAGSMEESSLFSQYEQEYCKKSTEAFQKISLVTTLSGGRRVDMLCEEQAVLRDHCGGLRGTGLVGGA